MALNRLFSKFFRTPITNRNGSLNVKQLICLLEHGDRNQTEPHIDLVDRPVDENNMQGLFELLQTDIPLIRNLAGAEYREYLRHVDYKLRRNGYGVRGRIEGISYFLYKKIL